MSYGKVALGVECAYPAPCLAARRPGRARRLFDWLRSLATRI